MSAFLVDDSLDTYYGWGGRAAATPANVMLFNTTAVPTKGTIDLEYPAIIVNGSSEVNAAYGALNTTPSRVVTLTSGVTDGFDNAVVAEQFGKLISVRRPTVGDGNNTAIFDLPVYADLGVDVIEKTVTFGSVNRMYLTYVPQSVQAAADGTIPMVLAMHGSGESAEYFALLSTWPEVGAREGFIVVSLDNHNAITNPQMVELLEGVFADYPQIDQSRVYASGFSMGSMHASNLGTQLTQYFAGMVPMDILNPPSNTAGLAIPTFYIGGQEDVYPGVFPSHTNGNIVTAPNNADRMLNYLFGVNDIRGGAYSYNASAANPWWGVDFDDVEVVPATHGNSVITINSLKSNDGVVYTKLVNTSALAHNILADHAQCAWDFISQFSRNADGTISVTSGAGIPVVVDVPEIKGALTMSVADFGDMVRLASRTTSMDRMRFEAELPKITVTDSRNATQAPGTGWAVSGRASAFVSGSDLISANHLAWAPRPYGTPREGVVFGSIVPGTLNGGPGLAVPATLMSAPPEARRGVASATADLQLEVPFDTKPGQYTSHLTVSLFPVD